MKITRRGLHPTASAAAVAATVLIVVFGTRYASAGHGDVSAPRGTEHAPTTTTTTGGGQWTWLSDMDWVSATGSWGPVERDMSNGENAAGDGNPIRLNKVAYAKGLGVVPDSTVTYDLGGRCSRLNTDIGIDDEVDTRGSGGSVVFQVYANGKKIYDSGVRFGVQWSTSVLPADTGTRHVDLSLTSVNELKLVTQPWYDGFNNDHADWAGARVLCTQA